MNKVEITQAFDFAHEGVRIERLEVGAIVEGRCAEVALETGKGVEVEARRKKSKASAKKNQGDESGDSGEGTGEEGQDGADGEDGGGEAEGN